MSEVVEHYLLRLTRSDVEGGDDDSKVGGAGRSNFAGKAGKGLTASLRNVKDGSLEVFDDLRDLFEYLNSGLKRNG